MMNIEFNRIILGFKLIKISLACLLFTYTGYAQKHFMISSCYKREIDESFCAVNEMLNL